MDERALREMAEDALSSWVNNPIAQVVESRASGHPSGSPASGVWRDFGRRAIAHAAEPGMDRFPAVASRIKLVAGPDIARAPAAARRAHFDPCGGAEMDVRGK